MMVTAVASPSRNHEEPFSRVALAGFERKWRIAEIWRP